MMFSISKGIQMKRDYRGDIRYQVAGPDEERLDVPDPVLTLHNIESVQIELLGRPDFIWGIYGTSISNTMLLDVVVIDRYKFKQI